MSETPRFVKPNATPAFTYKCADCGRRMQSDRPDIDTLWADTHGASFKDYLCESCKVRREHANS